MCYLFCVNQTDVCIYFLKFNWNSLHARLKQPQQGMGLQEKEAEKD